MKFIIILLVLFSCRTVEQAKSTEQYNDIVSIEKIDNSTVIDSLHFKSFNFEIVTTEYYDTLSRITQRTSKKAIKKVDSVNYKRIDTMTIVRVDTVTNYIKVVEYKEVKPKKSYFIYYLVMFIGICTALFMLYKRMMFR